MILKELVRVPIPLYRTVFTKAKAVLDSMSDYLDFVDDKMSRSWSDNAMWAHITNKLYAAIDRCVFVQVLKCRNDLPMLVSTSLIPLVTQLLHIFYNRYG